jgi:hypothetical protein
MSISVRQNLQVGRQTRSKADSGAVPGPVGVVSVVRYWGVAYSQQSLCEARAFEKFATKTQDYAGTMSGKAVFSPLRLTREPDGVTIPSAVPRALFRGQRRFC